MENWKESAGRKMETLCNFISTASRKTREAEIDVFSKRSYRLLYGSGNESSAPPIDAGTGLDAGMASTKIVLRGFLDCLNDAKNRVEWSRTDDSARRFYQKLPE